MGRYVDLAKAAQVQAPVPEKVARVTELADPRADLLEDSRLWRRLLGMAWDYDGPQPRGLCASLSCLRCLGAVLVRGNHGVWRLVASGDYWATEEAWVAECRVVLGPYQEVLGRMLATLEAEVKA